MLKKIISLFLAACLMAGLLAACSKKDDVSTPTPAPTKAATEAPQPTDDGGDEQEPEPDDPFPGADLGGVTLKIHVADKLNPDKCDEAQKEFWAERKAAVEEKFNVTLDFSGLEGIGWNDVPDMIVASSAAGDTLIDGGDMSRYYIDYFMPNNLLADFTSAVKNANLPKAYYEGGCQWVGGQVIGFTGEPLRASSILVYNRELILAAGMEKTPGEMFAEGNWSYDDFFNYCMELKTKLPEGVDVLGLQLINWARFAAYSNGASFMDPVTYIPTYTNDAFYTAFEFGQKLRDNDIMRKGIEVRDDDDNIIGYSTGWAQEDFKEGGVAISYADDWSFEEIASAVDFGVVPYPWGPNATIQNNDYKTLSSEYSSYYKDCGIWVLLKSAEGKITPEQYINLMFSYLEEEAEYVLINRENEKNGQPMTNNQIGLLRSFYTDLDVEIWDWFSMKAKMDPYDTTAEAGSLYQAMSFGLANNWAPRTAFEAVVGEDIYAMIEAGKIERSAITGDLAERLAEYEEELAAEEGE